MHLASQDCTQMFSPTELPCWPLPHFLRFVHWYVVSVYTSSRHLSFWYTNSSQALQNLTYWVLYSFNKHVARILLFYILGINKFSGLIQELQKLLTQVQPITNALKETKHRRMVAGSSAVDRHVPAM